MRVLISALCIAFAIGGSAWADCAAHAKKNDFETPPPIVLQQDQSKPVKN